MNKFTNYVVLKRVRGVIKLHPFWITPILWIGYRCYSKENSGEILLPTLHRMSSLNIALFMWIVPYRAKAKMQLRFHGARKKVIAYFESHTMSHKTQKKYYCLLYFIRKILFSEKITFIRKIYMKWVWSFLFLFNCR